MAEWHPIRVVARRTGLTPHVIRAWERRYQAVEPSRTPTNRRAYSNADVERLLLLRRATLAGRSIGQIAKLSTEELRELLNEDELAQSQSKSIGAPATGASSSTEASAILKASLDAVERLDGFQLQDELDRGSVALSRPVMMDQVIIPLMRKLGDGWQAGTLRVSHEHLGTAVVRSFVGTMNGAFNVPAAAPEIVFTTPTGQLHEIGALLACATAAGDGWRTTYLGPSLPAEEIAAAVEIKNAAAVGLSIVYPVDDPHLAGELRRLRKLLPETPILVGGRGSDAYQAALDQMNAYRLHDLQSLRAQLEAIRG